MIVRIKQIVLSLLILASFSSVAQIDDVKTVSDFTFSIKSIDQFIDRFNYDEKDPFRIAYEKAMGAEMPDGRSKALLSLFDLEMIERANEEYLTNVQSFIKEANQEEQAVFLSFYDSHWYASLEMDISFDGKSYRMQAVMANHSFKGNRSAWTIKAIKCEALGWDYVTSKPNILLPPNSEGTDFINFRHLIKPNSAEFNNRRKSAEMEEFFEYVAKGRLSFSYIKDIKYYFFQIPGYVMVLDEFRRERSNSGWLISNLLAVTSEEKSKMEQRMF
ncbi:hypothetical protein GCM10027429_24560 [Marivirga atlantica]|jgi:hypothetical protein|uniref:Uncharacterized protein n=1 Tax=Marivirga atlantica TaxID=1548457 RepID=A0A937DKB1_9BACT|nr:hypothetical protein [Marivirga atlantica]MBL0766056.1 hypothetical protein [Marivirga atlantica]